MLNTSNSNNPSSNTGNYTIQLWPPIRLLIPSHLLPSYSPLEQQHGVNDDDHDQQQYKWPDLERDKCRLQCRVQCQPRGGGPATSTSDLCARVQEEERGQEGGSPLLLIPIDHSITTTNSPSSPWKRKLLQLPRRVTWSTTMHSAVTAIYHRPTEVSWDNNRRRELVQITICLSDTTIQARDDWTRI